MDFSASGEAMVQRTTKDAFIYGASEQDIKNIASFIRDAYVSLSRKINLNSTLVVRDSVMSTAICRPL